LPAPAQRSWRTCDYTKFPLMTGMSPSLAALAVGRDAGTAEAQTDLSVKPGATRPVPTLIADSLAAEINLFATA